jgi:hypothetical protein
MAEEAATPIESGTALRNPTNITQSVDRVSAILGTPRGRPEGGDSESADATGDPVTPEAEESPEEAEAELADQAAKAEATDDEEAEAEPEGVEEELTVEPTLAALAEALEIDEQVLSEQLQVKVKINGRDEVVTLGEAVKGYQREADYTRRTMELGETKRQFDANVTQAASQLGAKFQEADTLLEFLQEKADMGWTREALAQLRDSDPAQYMVVKDALEDNRRALEAHKAKRENERQQAAEQDKQRFAEWHADQQRQLLSRMPELSKKENLAKFEDSVQAYLQSIGFAPEEVRQFMQTYDHRHVLIVRDAAKGRANDKTAEKVKLKLKSLPKKAKAGPKGNAKATELATMRDRLKKTGSARDMENILKARGIA